MKKLSKERIIQEILQESNYDLQDEEFIHLLLEKPLSILDDSTPTKAQSMTDKIAAFGGSWLFIIAFIILVSIWIIFNVLIQSTFDPYPFILLNLLLSLLSSLQAPIIMMAQNRQQEIDRKQSLQQYKVHLKNEVILQDLHQKLDELLDKNKDA